MRPVAGASDPVPFPELGKADTRSGNGAGPDACDVPACDAVRALDPVPVTERVSAFPSSVTGTGSSDRNVSLARPGIPVRVREPLGVGLGRGRDHDHLRAPELLQPLG